MSQNSSAKDYQNTKKDFQKKYQNLSEEKKQNNIVADDIKISQKMKNKGQFSKKKLQNMEK